MTRIDLPRFTAQQAINILRGVDNWEARTAPTAHMLDKKLQNTPYTPMEFLYYARYCDDPDRVIHEVTFKNFAKINHATWDGFLAHKRNRESVIQRKWEGQQKSFNRYRRKGEGYSLFRILTEATSSLGPLFRMEKLFQLQEELTKEEKAYIFNKYVLASYMILLGSPEYLPYVPFYCDKIAEGVIGL